MNWFGKLFKKKKKGYNTDGQYKLLIIDESKELIHEILGITDERAEQLLKIAASAFDKNETMHMGLVHVVDNCNHTNEVVFATMLYQKILEREVNKRRLFGAFEDLFGKR
jgi:hypothetical protein